MLRVYSITFVGPCVNKHAKVCKFYIPRDSFLSFSFSSLESKILKIHSAHRQVGHNLAMCTENETFILCMLAPT